VLCVGDEGSSPHEFCNREITKEWQAKFKTISSEVDNEYARDYDVLFETKFRYSLGSAALKITVSKRIVHYSQEG